MSSNIRIERICQHCGEPFIAKTTVTKYCGDRCAKRAYKQRKKNEKINQSEIGTIRKINMPMEELKAKDFLNVNEVARLIGISKRTVYRLIKSGKLKVTKIGRRTIISRKKLDELFQ